MATNPPWGAVRSGREESFALFIRQALRFLGPEGRLSFLLPEAVLNIRAHAPLRRMLFEECRIESVTLLGRCFTGVFTPVVRLDAVNAPPGDGHRFPVVHPDGARELHRQEPGCRDCAIETGISTADRALLDKIDACPHLTLAGNAEWALGIVTGDNAKLLASAPEPGAEPILRGCDIRPNRLKTPQRYLRPGKLQQAAPKRLYRTKPKLVYRFIANRPVCAVDPDGFLTLNSANLLIPHLPGLAGGAGGAVSEFPPGRLYLHETVCNLQGAAERSRTVAVSAACRGGGRRTHAAGGRGAGRAVLR